MTDSTQPDLASLRLAVAEQVPELRQPTFLCINNDWVGTFPCDDCAGDCQIDVRGWVPKPDFEAALEDWLWHHASPDRAHGAQVEFHPEANLVWVNGYHGNHPDRRIALLLATQAYLNAS